MSPDWRAVLEDQIAARGKRAGRRSVAVNYPTSLYAVVKEAAAARGMSMTAYQRRATLAFACNDLDLNDRWAELMAEEPPVASFDPTSAAPIAAYGFGPFGAWRIAAIGLFTR